MNAIVVNILQRVCKRAFWTKDHQPKRCCFCASTYLFETTTNVDCGVVSEFQVECGSCGELVQFWAYGCYNPYMVKPERFRDVIRRTRSEVRRHDQP